MEFQGRDPSAEARDKLDKARQKGSVKEYANYIRQQLLFLPKRDDLDNLHVFRRGLNHEIDAALALRRPATFSEAVEAALEVEASLQQRRGSKGRVALNATKAYRPTRREYNEDYDSDSSSGSQSEGSADCNAAQLQHGRNHKKKNTSEQRLRKLQASGRCFNCEEKGHLAKDCPHKKKGVKKNEEEDHSAGED